MFRKQKVFIVCVLCLLLTAVYFVSDTKLHTIYSKSATNKTINVSKLTNKQLAGQMLFLSSTGTNKQQIVSLAKSGVGGIALFYPISTKLANYVKKANKQQNILKPFIASDEEGGLVNRFRDVLYALPSAQSMGKKSNAKIKSITYKYGKGLKKYGLNTVFGPVLDLGIKNHYMYDEYRTFSGNGSVVASKALSWIKGYKKAGLITTVKHWPGMGYASNTHNNITTVNKFSFVKMNDLVPFNTIFQKSAAPMVMVAHEKVPGLTENNLPASLSKKAYKYLRKSAGNKAVLITDSLSMGAITSSLKLSVTSAVITALKNGADISLVVSNTSGSSLITSVAKAIKKGTISRKQAVSSVKRILKLKQKYGIISKNVKII
jgi:beta-N-acetylhexosaminidase